MRYEEALLLRVFIGEDDKFEGVPLYKYLTELCYKKGIAGVTVFRGVMGYGKSAVVHRSGILKLSSDMPMVVEVIDKEEKIETLLREIGSVLKGGLITVERVRIVRYN